MPVADAIESLLAGYAIAPFYWHPQNLPPTKKYRIEGGLGRIYHSGSNDGLISSTAFAAAFQDPYTGYSDLSFKLVQVFDDG